MPKLSALQWLLMIVFLAFYGFAVFAVTRDYYLRHPAQPIAVAPATTTDPHQGQASPSWVSGSVLDAGTNRIPDKVMETNPALLAQRADELFEQRRYDEAIDLYRRVLELSPGDPDAFNDLGLALHYTGDTQGAIRTLEEGAGAAPEYPRLWLTLGFVKARAGDRSGAEMALSKAQALSPESEVGKEAGRLLGQMRQN